MKTKEIKAETRIVYVCSICGESSEDKVWMERHEAQKPEEFEFECGDVIKFRWFYGDYSENVYGIINKRKYEDKHHRIGAEYVIDTEEVSQSGNKPKLYMTRNDRKERKRKIKKAMEETGLSYEIKWDKRCGKYKVTASLKSNSF